jgi:hypothetical protein
MIDEYGAFGGMRIGRGNQCTQRKPRRVKLFILAIWARKLRCPEIFTALTKKCSDVFITG